MFARRNRFSFRNGVPKNFFQTPFFVVRFDKNATKLEIAVVVGKKVDKRAVVRNKLKRQIVAIIKQEITPESILRLVIYAKKSVKEQEINTLKNDLNQSFEKLKIK